MPTLFRLLFFAVLFACPGKTAFAQTIFNAGELCAALKRTPSPTPPALAGPDGRSDSVDLVFTQINLTITDFAGQTIAGNANILAQPKVAGVTEVRFDLLGMTIDSVGWLNGPVTWNYDGASLRIQFPAPLDTAVGMGSLHIAYHGQPVQDASNWGGWYWQSPYAYNLGVGFDADPHNFGRAWFPCFDNFVERCSFRFRIQTAPDKPAYCNGFLVSDQIDPVTGLRNRMWWIQDDIPSYLACVAVGPFTSFTRTYAGETGPVPVEIAVAPGDSTKLKNSFANLPDALACYEYWFGPYRWNKIGYSIVPFTGGAMEHATNIAYPRFAVDGSLAYETLMAHEFSHHWWGDLATCTTAEDMWLNEGWAVFSEHLFTEWVYGRPAYLNAVRDNFLNVLQNTHVAEGGYRAVSGVPHDLTYGQHVYNKGAVVAHNLRGYLGDSLFRQGARQALDLNQFDDWSSAGLRDRLEAATGVELDDFFHDWVFSPGFFDVTVDSVRTVFSPVDAPTEMTVFVKQKRRGAPHFYQNVPVEFTFVDDFWNRQTRTGVVSGETDTLVFQFPAWGPAPRWVWVNTNGLLTFARAEREKVLKTPGSTSFNPARMDFKINTMTPGDSVLVRIEHHWAMPDTAGSANPAGYRLSNRYWTIDGDWPATGFDAQASVFYDGQGQLDQLDVELFAQTSPSEDSILLLYRPGAGHAWTQWPTYLKNTLGSAVNRYGLLRIDHVLPGQYAIAKGESTTAAYSPSLKSFGVRISPNPASASIRINADEAFDKILIFSQNGELLVDESFAATAEKSWPVGQLPAGAYWVVLYGKAGTAAANFQKM